MNELIKQIIKYGSIAIVVIFLSSFITGTITQKRANAAYSKLEDRYQLIEDSNTKLREENTRLISNNNELRELQQRDADTIKRGQDIVRELQDGVGDSLTTVERIERGLETLERLVTVLFREGE